MKFINPGVNADATLLRRLALGALLIGTALLVGCGGRNCDRPEPYQSSRIAPPLRVPDGLSVPPSHSVQKVPDVAAGVQPPVGGCLDRPPKFVAVLEAPAAPVPASASAAGSAPFSVGPAAATPQQQIQDMVESWARAWGRADGDGVVAFYASQFDAGEFADSPEWLAARRETVQASKAERVLVEALEISGLTGDAALVRFVQHFVTNGQGSAVVKEMTVVLDGDRWRIASEAVIDVL